MELPSILWFYFYAGLVGCPLIVLLYFFGDRITAFSERLEAEDVGREERNRTWIDEQNRQAAERHRVRDLANSELERLWRLKQGQ